MRDGSSKEAPMREPGTPMMTDDEIRTIYGDVPISRQGRYVLVHVDRPSPMVIETRTREFNPDEFFTDECPLCQLLRDQGVIVFDERLFADEEDGDASDDPGN
jgi:hypothetical protein